MAYEFNHYYEIQNVATGKYVNVLGNHEDGTVKNGETVNLFNRTNNPDQRWALENFGGNGNVRIVLQRGEGWEANCRAVTIETSNSGGAPEWPVSDTTFQTLVTLVADIARRNGLGKLVKGKNLTWHSMYAATACPGPYLSGKLQELVDKANTINGF